MRKVCQQPVVMECLESRQLLSGAVQNLGEAIGPVIKDSSLASNGATESYSVTLKHSGWIGVNVFCTSEYNYLTVSIKGPGTNLDPQKAGINLISPESVQNRLQAGVYTITVTRHDVPKIMKVPPI
jgi:hypothetical protein